jgi:signal transduction histidine kinase
MRVRKKLLFLHTLFSISLAVILLLALGPGIGRVLLRAESSEARVLLASLDPARLGERGSEGAASESGAGARDMSSLPGVPSAARVFVGREGELGLNPDHTALARARPGEPVDLPPLDGSARALLLLAPDGPADETLEGPRYEELFAVATLRIPEARRAVWSLYALGIAAVLATYALVVVALETMVLPQHVYGPIRSMFDADEALREGRREDELVPESAIPADELGEIMRSRNESVSSLRRHESALARALEDLETVATDLKRKNHLLENARRNLADADRLASLGMMSAGIAHELNTPLAVLKGLVEELHRDPARGMDADRAALMLRVVRRLEKLGESLLDFARARPAQARPASVREIVGDALTLVGLDARRLGVTLVNDVPEGVIVECDPDRMVQVLVNLTRNAADAILGARRGDAPAGRVEVRAEHATRDGAGWVSITVSDNGPGIEPSVISHLFEPFVSTRLDSHGTGLGLAVAEGIVREHGGVLLARNNPDRRGAVFEIMLPRSAAAGTGDVSERKEDEHARART